MSSPKPSNRPVIPPEIEAEMTPAVKAFVEILIDHYEARITELESKVQKLTPQNSSLPPSTQHPHAKSKRPKRDGKKKKRGGQKGHKKHQRDLIPPEQCDDIIPLWPDACRRCGEPLAGTDPEPLRHQVWGTARNQTDSDRVPAAPFALFLLRDHDMCFFTGRCTLRAKRSTTGGFYRTADGPLPPKQTSGVAVSSRSAEDALLSEPHGQDAEPGCCGHSGSVRATEG